MSLKGRFKPPLFLPQSIRLVINLSIQVVSFNPAILCYQTTCFGKHIGRKYLPARRGLFRRFFRICLLCSTAVHDYFISVFSVFSVSSVAAFFRSGRTSDQTFSPPRRIIMRGW
jgi:hypothetical protein